MKKLLTLLLLFSLDGCINSSPCLAWDASTFIVDAPQGSYPGTTISVHVTRVPGANHYQAVTMPQRYATGTSCTYLLGQVSQACASHTTLFLNNPVDTVIVIGLDQLEAYGDSLLVSFWACGSSCTYASTIKIKSPNNPANLQRCQDFGCAAAGCFTTNPDLSTTTHVTHGHVHHRIRKLDSGENVLSDEYYDMTGQKMNTDYLQSGFYIHVITSETGVFKEKIIIN